MNGDDVRSLDPATVERKVEQIWRDVLGVRDGQPNATFFDLQGQSISAVRIAARIEDELGVAIDLADLFEDPDLQTFVRQVLTMAGAAR